MGLFALRRYIPYMRPYLGLVIVFGLAQLGSLAAAASIPKVIQLIIDGPIAHHQLSQLLPMAGLLVLIGLLEFVLVHVGFAISKVDPLEAARAYAALEELGFLAELTDDLPSAELPP